MPRPYESEERQVARGDRLKAALQGAVRPTPRPARRRLTEDGLAARVIDLGREVERITGSEIVLPQSAIDAVDEAVSARFPEEPYGPVAERFRATQLEIAKGALTLDGQIEGVPATREVFLNMHPEIRADLTEARRFQNESQEQTRDVLTLAKLTAPRLATDPNYEAEVEGRFRDAVATGREPRRALLEILAEESDDAAEALTDFHVATAPDTHQYEGDGREYYKDIPDAEIDAALDRPVTPTARRAYTQDEIDAMSDEELDAATHAAITAGE